jgi:diketogulonate reductase-like aldo/keto reductase
VIKAAGATTLFASLATQAEASGAPATPAAATGGGPLTRIVPATGERVPAVGLGTFMTFDKWPASPRDHIKEVLNRFQKSGGRVVDTSPLYGQSEINVGQFAKDLFITNKSWTTGEFLNDDSHARRQLEQSLTRLGRKHIDVLQVHSLTAVDMLIPILRRFKAEGKIRMLGVTHHDPRYFPIIEHWIATGDLDFVQVHYSIQMRDSETRLLKLAADHGTGVMVNMPLEKARLHDIVKGRPVPKFAAHFAPTWSAFFLKYVLANPAVTVVLPATSNPTHLDENMAAGHGPLPDRDTRRKMLRYMQEVPGFSTLQSRPWYPGKVFDGQVKL